MVSFHKPDGLSLSIMLLRTSLFLLFLRKQLFPCFYNLLLKKKHNAGTENWPMLCGGRGSEIIEYEKFKSNLSEERSARTSKKFKEL